MRLNNRDRRVNTVGKNPSSKLPRKAGKNPNSSERGEEEEELKPVKRRGCLVGGDCGDDPGKGEKLEWRIIK